MQLLQGNNLEQLLQGNNLEQLLQGNNPQQQLQGNNLEQPLQGNNLEQLLQEYMYIIHNSDFKDIIYTNYFKNLITTYKNRQQLLQGYYADTSRPSTQLLRYMKLHIILYKAIIQFIISIYKLFLYTAGASRMI